jgi:hypothetical protein
MEMAFEAKSMAHLRKVATALQVYANGNEGGGGLPSTLDELVRDDRWDLHPLELKDGWGRDLRYQRLEPFKFRLSSDGPDGIAGNADDTVLENGVVAQGGIDPRTFRQPPRGE